MMSSRVLKGLMLNKGSPFFAVLKGISFLR